MTARARLHANRINALRSTGPRTPVGLARSAQNALKVGLFSRLLVLPALGETPDEMDQFRNQVSASLDPVGAVEQELADRIATVMWRLRRVARYEAAAMKNGASESIPSHPDEVAPLDGDVCYQSVPPGAPVTYRLAHLRARLQFSINGLEASRVASTVFEIGARPTERIETRAVWRVFGAAQEELGSTAPESWAPVLAVAGFRNLDTGKIKWTAARFRRLLRFAADTVGRPRREFLKAVRDQLRKEATDLEQLINERREEEKRLVELLYEQRASAMATQLYSDEMLIQRVARAESHLSRELDRALLLLSQLQRERREIG